MSTRSTRSRSAFQRGNRPILLLRHRGALIRIVHNGSADGQFPFEWTVDHEGFRHFDPTSSQSRAAALRWAKDFVATMNSPEPVRPIFL